MAKACIIDGCDKPQLAHGWCTAHYTRWRRHGDPLAGGTPLGAPLQWLFDHRDYDGEGCLIWPFGTDATDGYGRVHFEGVSTTACRVMCIIAHGEPPTPKHESGHSCGCGHLGCVHPKHLRWLTRSQNMMEKVDHGTDNRGEKHYAAKLTESDVRMIRDLRGKMSQREIGRIFNIHQVRVSDIQLRKEWAWLD